ncbi:MAG: hypothetical protein ABR552_09800 [Actinomycetota bacterium]
MSFLAVFNPDWWLFIHLVGVFGFLITHGVSVSVALRLRNEPDRERIRQMLSFSGSTIWWMYLTLAVLTVGGILRATSYASGIYWKQAWPKVSLGVLFVAMALMGAIARPYYQGIKAACELRPSGEPRVSDEDLRARLRGWQPWAITIVGFAALLALLSMMVFKKPA